MIINNQIPEWIILNNQVVDENGNIKDLSKDKEAVHSYFINYVNNHTKFFHTLQEKIKYLVDNRYWEKEFLEKYTFEEIKALFKLAYSKKFRFNSYMSAFKFYNDYALRDRKDPTIFLERYEDRLCVIALYHANGDIELAKRIIISLIQQDFTPATPTLLNTGRVHRGEMVSCFLYEIGDSLNDISRSLEFAMQLSKKGGGVSLNVNNLRARGESVNGAVGACKGVVGVMKLLDNAFRYADQMGARTGAGATYLSVFHADIEEFLATKKINADEDTRVKTLSIGVILSDLFINAVKEDKDYYAFYPHNVKVEYGVDFADVCADIDKWYQKLLDNPNIKRKKINARKLFTTMAAVAGESGYPYLAFQENIDKGNVFINRKVKFSNLCTEILQPTKVSSYADYHEREKDEVGLGVSCNLASGHITNMIKHKSIKETVYNAMEIMNSVSEKTNIKQVPEIAKANSLMRSVGFGTMDLHGFFVKNYILYGSEESIDFCDVFFNMINYYSLKWSMEKAKKTNSKFFDFENTTYADGSYFEDKGEILPKTEKVKEIFKDIEIPTQANWIELKENVMKYGLYNSHRLALAPNGSIGYVMGATAGVTPIKQLVEERSYGNSKTYFPMPYLQENDSLQFLYETAYNLDKFKIINVISTIQKHIDQGISLEICINSNTTTRDLSRTQLYAHHKGLKTLYYTRTRKLKVQECLSCAI